MRPGGANAHECGLTTVSWLDWKLAVRMRGLRGMTSTGGTMRFGGIWSFIIGAQVAFTLLCLPAAAGIYRNTQSAQSKWAEFPTLRSLRENEAELVPERVTGPRT